MNTFQGLGIGAGYGAMVAASSTTIGGLMHATYLVATDEASEASIVLMTWTLGGGFVASIIGTMIGGLLGALLAASNAGGAASPLASLVVAAITGVFITLAQHERPFVAFVLIPIVGLATGVLAWWSGRRFADAIAIPPAPAGAPILAGRVSSSSLGA